RLGLFLSDQQVLAFLQQADDRLVEFVAADADRVRDDEAARGCDAHLARATSAPRARGTSSGAAHGVDPTARRVVEVLSRLSCSGDTPILLTCSGIATAARGWPGSAARYAEGATSCAGSKVVGRVRSAPPTTET